MFKKYKELTWFSKETGLYVPSIMEFLVIRSYLRKEQNPTKYEVTVLGKMNGLKKKGDTFYLSETLTNRLIAAFNYKTNMSLKEQAEVIKLLKAVEVGKHD